MTELSQILDDLKDKHIPVDTEAVQKELASRRDNYASWPVKILTWIGAWLGAGLFAGFLAMVDLLDSESSMIVMGSIFLVGAILVKRGNPDSPVIEPFSLAANVLGQGLIAVGLFEIFHEPEPVMLIAMGVEIGILLLSPSSIQRFLAVILFNLALAGLIWETKAYHALHVQAGLLAAGLAGLLVEEPVILARYKRLISYLNPLTFGFLASLFSILALSVNRDWFDEEVSMWWLASLFMIGTLLYVADSALETFGQREKRWIVFALIIMALSPTVLSPGISASILVLILGLYRGQRFVLGLGIMGLVYFIGAFYYNLNTTLLVKSLLLILAGSLFLAAAWGMKFIRHDA